MVLVRAPSALSPTPHKGDVNGSEGHRAAQGEDTYFTTRFMGRRWPTWRFQCCTGCFPIADREVGRELNPGSCQAFKSLHRANFLYSLHAFCLIASKTQKDVSLFVWPACKCGPSLVPVCQVSILQMLHWLVSLPFLKPTYPSTNLSRENNHLPLIPQNLG